MPESLSESSADKSLHADAIHLGRKPAKCKGPPTCPVCHELILARFVMGQSHDNNSVTACLLLSSLPLTWDQAIILDPVLYMNTSSCDLNANHQGKKAVKVKTVLTCGLLPRLKMNNLTLEISSKSVTSSFKTNPATQPVFRRTIMQRTQFWREAPPNFCHTKTL